MTNPTLTADEHLSVGDICIGQNFNERTECNGQECQILRGPEFCVAYKWGTDEPQPPELLFKVLWADGDISWQARYELRKKRPPREITARWEDVPYFNPTEVTA